MSSISVIGAGYVGLVSAACFADLGHRVICADINPERIAMLKASQCPIYELGLEELLERNQAAGRLEFVLGAKNSVRDADFIYLCLPTPSRGDGSADTSYVDAVVREIRPILKPGAVVVTKSTVPVGTGERVTELLGRSDVHVASNPEFLREGTAVKDFQQPDRIVVGAADRAVAKRVADLYQDLKAPVVLASLPSAEMIKYVSNAFLATKLSFINTVAALCEQTHADISDVARGMGADTRIGSRFLNAGPGYGGSCFPKDTLELLRLARSVGTEFDILASAIAMNHEQFDRVVDKIAARFDGDLKARRIAVWGIAFKAGTDDVRESPAVHIINRLLDKGATVAAYDPEATAPSDLRSRKGFVQLDSYERTCSAADAVLIATEWPEFKDADFALVGTLVRQKHMIDARSILDGVELSTLGWSYTSIGRSPIEAMPQNVDISPAKQLNTAERASNQELKAAQKHNSSADLTVSAPGSTTTSPRELTRNG